MDAGVFIFVLYLCWHGSFLVVVLPFLFEKRAAIKRLNNIPVGLMRFFESQILNHNYGLQTSGGHG